MSCGSGICLETHPHPHNPTHNPEPIPITLEIMKSNFVIIFITCGSKKEADRIVDSLLRKRLIACANMISGVESRFRWKGKLDKAKEILVILKAKEKQFCEIEKEVKRIHGYEVPEIIAASVAAGSKEYLEWLSDS